MTQLKPVELTALQCNPFTLLDSGWALLTIGTAEKFNTMTISWGTMGIFWGKPVFETYVRPQRYTHDFIEEHDTFTISFFGQTHREALAFCGSKSGRDYDKVKETGLTPVFLEDGIAFEEASLVFVCKKNYRSEMQSTGIIDPHIETFYPQKDYHHCYYGEILAAYQK